MPAPAEAPTASHAPVERQQPEAPPTRGVRPEFLATLPMTQREADIKHLLHENSQVIIVGQTGSGKSIVLPEFILDVISNNGQDMGAKMIITQPRKLAVDNAVDSLNRLGKEKIGVRYKGYKGEQQVSDKTNIDVMVAGSLLNMLADGLKKDASGNQTLLMPYKAVMIDEVHEESIDSHLNRILLKKVQALRKEKGMPPLQVIFTSGSVDVPKIKEDFKEARDIEIEGRKFEVADHFSTEEIAYEDMPIAAAKRALDILADSTKDGNILAIMPGRTDITATITEFKRQLQTRGDIQNKDNIEVISITGGDGDRTEQMKALEKSSKRRFFVGTPVVEASVTIDNLQHVIDSGLMKMNVYDSETGLSSLRLVRHTKANWKQRKGRAGRVTEGDAWYLFTKEQFEGRDDYPKPEILHTDLTALALRMKQIGIDDIYGFEYIDDPGKDRLDAAVSILQQLGALDKTGTITPIGEEMGEIPVDPHFGRMMVEAKKRGCVEAASVLVAFLNSNKSVFAYNSRVEQFDKKYARYIYTEPNKPPDSDYLTLLKIWNEYNHPELREESERKMSAEQWAMKHGFNLGVLHDVDIAKNEILKEDFFKGAFDGGLGNLEIDIAAKAEALKACITTGFMDRVLLRNGNTYVLGNGKKRDIRVARSSVFAKEHPGMLISGSLRTQDGGRVYADMNQRVTGEFIREVAPYLEQLGLAEKAPEVQKAVEKAKEELHAEVAKVADVESKSEVKTEEVKLSIFGKVKQAWKSFIARIKAFLGL